MASRTEAHAPSADDVRPAGAASETVGRRLWRLLREHGLAAVYGDGGGLPVVLEAPGHLAPVLAQAHELVHRSRAATWLDQVLTVGPGPLPPDGAGSPNPGIVRVGQASELAAAVRSAATSPGGLQVKLDLDLDGPASAWEPAGPAPAAGPFDLRDAAAALRRAHRVIVLAGPGVIDAGAVPGLHALAAVAGLGVLNTWGAKGVFPWRSPHHWATIGLQQDDFRFGGLADADLIVATGLDPRESPDERWQLSRHVSVDPRDLGDLADGLRDLAHREQPAMPVLRRRLAEVTERGWRATAVPLSPLQVSRAYGEVAAAGGLVVADPGAAGFWVARTVATQVMGSVVVPASSPRPGFAVAGALVARLARPGRLVLAVTDRPPDGACADLLDLARRRRLPVPLERWTADGARLDPEAHRRRLHEAVYGEDAGPLALATADGWLAAMEAAAGPVIAWAAQ